MPLFENSQNTDARGGTFNDVGRDQIHGDQVYHINQVITNTGTIQAIITLLYTQVSRDT